MRLRTALSVFVWSFVVLVLGGCTSSIAGTATFGGPTDTTEESSSEETTTEEETTEELPSGEAEEIVACISVLFAYDTANANFVALADATNNGTPTSLTPESVATDFDAAINSVQPTLGPLPQGDVRDAIQAAQDAASALRDGLRAGTDVANNDLNAALDSIDTACEF